MGIINQAWRDTMALLGKGFAEEVRAAGWPASFQIEHIAVLQRPYQRDDVEAMRLRKSLFYGLKAACTSGELAHSVQGREVIDSYLRVYAGDRIRESYLGGTTREATFRRDPVYKLKDFVYVAAPAFKTWLAAQNAEPSVHIQAWFDAVGVAGAAVPDAAVIETIAKRNARWLTQLEAANEGTSPPSDTAIYKQIAAVDNVGWEAVKKAVGNAKKAQAQKYRDGNVKPLARGKKSAPELSTVWGNRTAK